MLCYSTSSLPPVSFTQITQILKSTIFKGIELVILPEWLNQPSQFWTQALHVFTQAKFEVRNIHVGYPLLASSIPHKPGIGDLDATERKKRWDIILKCFSIAETLNAKYLTITSGILSLDQSLEKQEKICYHFFEWILKHKPQSIQLGIEQEPEHIIHSSSQLLKLCKHFQGQVKVNFDIGHSAVLKENISKSIQSLFPYLYNLHLEDILNAKHQHLLFGDGDINFATIKNTLKDLNYQGDYTPDLYPFSQNYSKALIASESFLKNFI